MLFSRVKISCFCAKAHLVFHQCLCNRVIVLLFLAGGAGGGASLMGAPALLSLLPQGGLLQASKHKS